MFLGKWTIKPACVPYNMNYRTELHHLRMAAQQGWTAKEWSKQLSNVPLTSSPLPLSQLPYILTFVLGAILYVWLVLGLGTRKASGPSIPAGPRGLPILGMWLIIIASRAARTHTWYYQALFRS